MRVAVVTPYFRESEEVLRHSVVSVCEQTHPCSHILVCDGEPRDWLTQAGVQHLVLGANHDDYGGTPRGIGSVSAIAQGFDAVAYLDADNWFYPEHIASLVALHQRTGAAVCTSARNLHRLDGSLLGRCPEVDGERFVDTNCLFLTRAAYRVVPVWWAMPADLHAIDDRVMWSQIVGRGLSRAHSGAATVGYRTGFAFHYRRFGETPPAGAKSGEDVLAAMRRVKAMRQEDMEQGDAP